MIIVSLRQGPVDVSLEDILPGFSIRLNRLTSMDFALARDRAAQALESVRDGLSALSQYGLHQADVTGHHLDLSDQAQMFRVGHLLFSTELALLAVASWSGPVLENRMPAPIDRETLARLLMDETIEQRMLKEIGAAAQIVFAEKKDLPASLNGSAAGDVTGSAPNTAADAPAPDSLAAAASPAPRGDTARNLN